MTTKKYAVVTDFDGTVTSKDIGNCLAVHLGATTPEQIVEDYKNIDAKTWMDKHFGNLKMTREEFESLVLSYAEIKPGFEELAQYARQTAMPFEIASGGLDIYINPVLRGRNLAYVPVYSVRGTFTELGIAVDFPHFPDLSLGDFKLSRVKKYQEQGYTVIFLGDGPSDFKAAAAADITFATSHLERLCKERGVKYLEFKDFKKALDIVRGKNVSLPA